MSRSLYVALFLLLLCVGCKEPSRPADIPPLYPCTVTVTQESVPLSGAYVELISPDSPKYRPASTTNESGKAIIMTYGYEGAPAGKYKIIVRKSIDEDIEYGKGDYGQQTIVSSKTYNVVEDMYSKADRSPHEVEVVSDSKGVETTIDVGKAIKVLIRRNR